ncbi:hypothetical protein EU546_06595 [Candidatus Thorarchaeota archaeon]|nr:MAG: hypothetical protein EU546_06595 [Candidatus Thorarchaeota archaeon]
MSVPDGGGVAMEIYLGIQRRGYSWIFPKRDELSLGIGCRMDLRGDMRREWRTFTEKIREEKGIGLDFRRKSTFRVPVRRTGSRLTARRSLLVGDAAGLVSPVTGEGIYYAIYSGRLAAKIIAEAAERKSPLYIREYDIQLQNRLVPELETAGFVADVLFRSERSCEIVCDIASKDETMRDLMIDFVTGSRPAKKLRIPIAKRLLTRHPLKALRLGLNV